MRTDTIFRIFSMTKPVTGLTMGILADRGLWRPDDAVADHLPELRNLRVATGFDDRGAPILADPVHPPRDWSAPPAAAMGGMGLVSTIGDYARFAQLLLDRGEWHGRRIVSAESVTAQMSNQLPEPLLEHGFHVGHMDLRPGFGYGYNGAVFHDPALAGSPVGRGTYQWDGAAGTWFWADPEHDLLYIGMIQLLSYAAPPLQKITQALLADAILDPGTPS